MALISVVVASYNHATFIQDCLHSARMQDVDDLEILVTDDGSTDGTPSQVTAIADPRIRLKEFPQNRGACVALNDAIKRSSGEYIAVLNSDDIFLPGKLRRQLEFLQRNPQLGAVFGWPAFIDEAGLPFDDPAHKDHLVFKQANRSRHQWLRHFFDHGNALCHPTVMMRREVFRHAGLYDPRLAQVPDLDQWIRVCMRYDIHVLQEPLTSFRIRDAMQNASAARPEVVRRDAWERAYVLRHYLNLPPEELRQVFPEFSGTGTSLTEQLASYALSRPMPFFQRFGLDTWFQSLPAGGALDQVDQMMQDEISGDATAWQRYISAVGASDPHGIYR